MVIGLAKSCSAGGVAVTRSGGVALVQLADADSVTFGTAWYSD
ncbi:MAG: hypothetical protein RML75_13315 [Cyanobacteriota bacterium SKYGB_h_bin112]|nr:hypothetical protein [Cyanobacteriota bacterium SKYGB_h_bin112]